MTLSAGRTRLSRAERRAQLLRTALEVIRTDGVAAVTLSRVAEAAGVSKPVAYDHFGSADGLLIALYVTIDREQGDALRRALEDEPHDLHSAAARIATTYMRCCADTAGEGHAIAGALRGNEDMAAAHRELLDGYIDLFVAGLAPHSDLEPAELRGRCIALVGAADALAAEMIRGTIAEPASARTLSAMIAATLAAA